MVKVVEGLPVGWGACYQIVSLDIATEALSYWNKCAAIGTFHGTIIILNVITGDQMGVLSGHTGGVNSVTFSPDGASLISGGDDKTIKCWDVQTGGVIKTFFGHTEGVTSVSISPDCTMIASASDDGTICLWNIQTGECCQTMDQKYLKWVGFFPTTPQYLVSISLGGVQEWNIHGHKTAPAYTGSCVAFSPDGTQFVLCNDTVAVVQNSDSREIVAEFCVGSDKANNCCFSPDGRLIAFAALSTIYIWNISSSNPFLIETFFPHTSYFSLTFSSPSSLISISSRESVSFWGIGISDPIAADTKFISLDSAPIMSTTLQAKDGIIVTSDLNGVARIWDILTGLCKATFQTPAEGHDRRDARLIDGRLTVVWYMDKKINIWDAEKGEPFSFFYEPWRPIRDLRISGDGSRVFCSCFRSVFIWSTQTGELVDDMFVDSRTIMSALTVGSSKVWAHHYPPNSRGWELIAEDLSLVEMSNIPIPHLNGSLLWDVNHSRVKDMATGRVVFQLSRRFKQPIAVEWNGQYLVVCSGPREVLVLDFSHMLLQ